LRQSHPNYSPCPENRGIISQNDHVHKYVQRRGQCGQCCDLVSFERPFVSMHLHSRPINSAVVFNVPCSASNLSIRGVKTIRLTIMCRKPMCIKGKVLSRYTDRHISVSGTPSCNMTPKRRLSAEAGYPRVPTPISFGIRDPHSVTLHTVCNSTTQKASTANMHPRVNRGSRRR